MFYYYGRKKQIAKHYPLPISDTIIEPFAGSAAYSLFGENWKRNVILIEKDLRVAAVWGWLINRATVEDIQNLPDLKVGEKTSDFFHILHAATKMAFKYKTITVTPVLARNWDCSKRYIANNLYKVKHWKILCGDYTEAPDIAATWFIDPPYKGSSGNGYDTGSKSIDYQSLAKWSLARKGQIIFCEGTNGDYLPFEPLLTLMGVAGKRSEERLFHHINRRESRELIRAKTPNYKS